MRLHLIVDADDTLWENNIYFERAFEEFVDFLGHSSLNAREIRAVLDEIEEANSKIHGYGSLNFGRNLWNAKYDSKTSTPSWDLPNESSNAPWR